MEQSNQGTVTRDRIDLTSGILELTIICDVALSFLVCLFVPAKKWMPSKKMKWCAGGAKIMPFMNLSQVSDLFQII